GGPLGCSGLAVFAQCPQLPTSQNEHLPLLPASRRTSPPVSVRDAHGTSSLSSSSNSGSCKGSDSSPTPRHQIFATHVITATHGGIPNPEAESCFHARVSLPPSELLLWVPLAKAFAGHQDVYWPNTDTEIDDLKMQLSRMQEDWIEEECHRVEAQLALKEARKEIKQLKQVIDTVKNSLIDKDKGLQKYFVDINIQNKKLETLLHSMEVAQNGFAKEDGAAESAGGGFVATDDTLSRTDALEASSLLSSGVDCGPEEGSSLHGSFSLGPRFPASNTYEKLLCGTEAGVQASCMQERAIQTDFVQYQPDLDTILEKVTKAQVCGTVPKPGDRCPESDPHPLGPRDPNSAVVVMVGDELEAPEPITRGPTPHHPGPKRQHGRRQLPALSGAHPGPGSGGLTT
ncbi:hypothetical protein E2I00_001475, partial [Balaenoptera physalus]